MLLDHNHRTYAAGLVWATAHNAGEARRESRRLPKARRVAWPADGQIWLGLYDRPVKGRAYAAALAIGMVEPNAIVCKQVSPAQSWLCAIVDGLPVIDYDILVATDRARDTVLEWTSLFGRSAFVGDLPGAKASLAELFDSFDQGLASRNITARQLSQMRLRRQDVAPGKVVALAAALGAAAFAWYGWTRWQGLEIANRARESAVAAAARRALDAQRTAAEKRQRIEAFRKQVQDRREELARQQSTSPLPLWRAWQGVRRALPLVDHGYAPQSLQCDASACQVEWLGTGAFTLPADKRLLPGALPDAEPDLHARSRFELAPPRQPSSAAAPPAAATPEALRLAMASAAQVHLPGLRLDPMQPVTVTPAAGLGLPPATAGAVGQWHYSIDGPAAPVLAEEAMAFLAQWPVQLTSLRHESLVQAGRISLSGTYTLAAGAPQ